MLNRQNYSVFQKSDAKIEITLTATKLIRIKYPLSIFNYHLSGASVANFNKIYYIVFEQQLFKKMELKNRSFHYGKVALAVRTQYHQLQFVLKVVAICTDCEVLPSFSTPTPQSRLVAAYL